MNNISFRKPVVTKREDKYSRYGFNQNPFPFDPTVKPTSTDYRENGSVFLEELRSDELDEFKSRIVNSNTKIGFLMDYAAYRGRGIGKTAFLNYVKNLINTDLGLELSKEQEVLYAIYVTPSPDKRERNMSLIARNIYNSMLSSDLFLIVFSRLRAFSGIIPENVLDEVSNNYRETIANDEWLKNRNVYLDQLNKSVESTLRGIGIDVSFDYNTFMPRNSYEIFMESIKLDQSDYIWKNKGCDFLFTTLVRLFKEAYFTHCIILLDEVEKIVTYQNFAERHAFCDSLRNYFIDGGSFNAIEGFYKILLTIHPNSQELLMPHWSAAGLNRFSELGGTTANQTTIFFQPIKNTGDIAVKLAQTYMERARETENNSIRPFTEEALTEAMLRAGNIPGAFLRYVYMAIEKGIELGWDTIDKKEISQLWTNSTDFDNTNQAVQLPETKIEL